MPGRHKFVRLSAGFMVLPTAAGKQNYWADSFAEDVSFFAQLAAINTLISKSTNSGAAKIN